MKKIAFALVILLTLGACLPFDIPGFPTATLVNQDFPTQTDIAPTPTPLLPSPTTVPVSDTPVIASASPTTEINLAPSATPPSPDLTTTPATSTDLPANPASTNTATLVPGQPTLTPTLGILTYGTIPPSVPFNTITVWNRSKAQAYISLQVTLNDGRYTIIEYPVEGQINIKAPVGSYIYVAWVGGNKLVGGFKNHAGDSLVILLFKDKVVIK